MLESLHSSMEILASGPPAEVAQTSSLRTHFGIIPTEYAELVSEATEVELQHNDGQYIRIWGPMGCIEMDEGYGMRQRIAAAFPIGDDGGGHVIFYQNGKNGPGLYHVGYGNLDGMMQYGLHQRSSIYLRKELESTCSVENA